MDFRTGAYANPLANMPSYYARSLKQRAHLCKRIQPAEKTEKKLVVKDLDGLQPSAMGKVFALLCELERIQLLFACIALSILLQVP